MLSQFHSFLTWYPCEKEDGLTTPVNREGSSWPVKALWAGKILLAPAVCNFGTKWSQIDIAWRWGWLFISGVESGIIVQNKVKIDLKFHTWCGLKFNKKLILGKKYILWIWWTSWFWISDLYFCISTCCRRGWLRVRWGFWIMCACSLPIFFWALCLLLDQQHMLFSPHLYFHNWYTNKYYYLFLKAFSILSLGPSTKG